MTDIPTNITGSLFQAQFKASESAKKDDARRNKRIADSEELARLADQQTSEVEDADHAEGLNVHREDERKRDGQDARDTYESHEDQSSAKIYNSEGNSNEDSDPDDQDDVSESSDPDAHIDFSA